MNRVLPIVEIDGVDFYIDVLRDELWQAGRPENTISFDAFEAVDNGYFFIYNKKSREWAGDRMDGYAGVEDQCVVLLPALMELDPEGMALHYEIPLEIISPGAFPNSPRRIIAKLYPLSYRHSLVRQGRRNTRFFQQGENRVNGRE